MANALTGDFDAVLQISNGTVNRLLASMHQNAFSNPELPSFPHTVALRIGDDRAVEGVRGSVRAQVGSPRISFLNGVTDRFRLEVAVRARYRADPGSTPLAEFIHGTITAEYRIADIDPNCLGYRRNAADYLWLRVVEESVRFNGTAVNPRGFGFVVTPDPDLIPRITRQITRLLARRFVASPHPVDKRFRRGSIRTLVAGGQSGACLAVPVGNEPSGNLASVNQLFLNGANMAVAVASDAILRLAGPVSATVASYRPSYKVKIEVDYFLGTETIEGTYHTVIDPPSVQWLAFGSHGVIRLRTTASAKVPSKLLPDFTFQISQDIVVSFDAGSQSLNLGEGARSVTVQSSFGIPKQALDNVASTVDKSVKSAVLSALSAAQPSANAITAQNADLIAMLRTFDPAPGTRHDSAEFVAEGLILRGSVYLSRRNPPVAEYVPMTDEEGYTALTSWVPGGRVDEFRWSWTWFGTGEKGALNEDDRFILQRPVVRTKWGGTGAVSGISLEERRPLPGLDGSGRVCVEIRGVHADPVSGELVPSLTRSACRRFGLPISTGIGVYWRYREPLLVQDVPFPELAVVDIGSLASKARANTLLLSIGEEWDQSHEQVLLEALAGSRREDAGLAVVVLFRDGHLERDAGDLVRRIESLGLRAGAPVLVNEDVMGSWTRTFVLPQGRDAWRLISPGGGVTWMHDGRAPVEEIVRALDQGLFPSPAPAPAPVSPFLRPGILFPVGDLVSYLDELDAPQCPPYPKGRLGLRETVVGFALAGSSASSRKLRELNSIAARDSDGALGVVTVLTGASEQEASHCRCEAPRGSIVVADPDGSVARRFGVSMWPTTLRLNSRDIVVKADFGLDVESTERREN